MHWKGIHNRNILEINFNIKMYWKLIYHKNSHEMN